MPRRITQVESMERAPSRWATGHRVAESWTLFGAGLQVAGRLTTGWPESRTLLGAGLRTAGRLATGWLESRTLFGAGLYVAGRLTTGWPESRTLLGAGLHAMRAECIQLGLGQRHASGNCTSTDEPSEPCVMTRTVIVQHHAMYRLKWLPGRRNKHSRPVNNNPLFPLRKGSGNLPLQ